MVPCGLLDWLLRGMKSYHPQGIFHLFPFGGTVTYHWRQKVATQMKGPQTR